jgi:hypothetical protein
MRGRRTVEALHEPSNLPPGFGLLRFSPEREEAEDQVSPVVHPACVVKAPEDWRSPRPRGLSTGPEHREASWTTVTESSESPLWL